MTAHVFMGNTVFAVTWRPLYASDIVIRRKWIDPKKLEASGLESMPHIFTNKVKSMAMRDDCMI